MKRLFRRLRDFIKTHTKLVIVVSVFSVVVAAGVITACVVAHNNNVEAERIATEQREQEEREEDERLAEEERLAEGERLKAEEETKTAEITSIPTTTPQTLNNVNATSQAVESSSASEDTAWLDTSCPIIQSRIDQKKSRTDYGPRTDLLLSDLETSYPGFGYTYNECVQAGRVQAL